ncbi:MAG: hypothetical protein IT558_02490 [Alphaproteobacteria bacterium]|nr:hypothetical protein [Alphaproteobacteria bacterium]
MNIDLLFSKDGEAGLISSQNLIKKALGVVLDTQNGMLTLEFTDSDYMDLNIPVEKEFFAALDYCAQIHVGAIKDGHIAQAYQIPFMFLDDPYRGEAYKNVKQPDNPLMAFNAFVKRCTAGQPVHRDDLGNEDAMGCVLGDASPASLQFAPHLARRHALEAGVRTPVHGPRMGGPGLGLGSSGSGGGTVQRIPPDDKKK